VNSAAELFDFDVQATQAPQQVRGAAAAGGGLFRIPD
jgi:hypothetical protein